MNIFRKIYNFFTKDSTKAIAKGILGGLIVAGGLVFVAGSVPIFFFGTPILGFGGVTAGIGSVLLGLVVIKAGIGVIKCGFRDWDHQRLAQRPIADRIVEDAEPTPAEREAMDNEALLGSEKGCSQSSTNIIRKKIIDSRLAGDDKLDGINTSVSIEAVPMLPATNRNCFTNFASSVGRTIGGLFSCCTQRQREEHDVAVAPERSYVNMP